MTILDIAQSMKGRLRDGLSQTQSGTQPGESEMAFGTAIGNSSGGYVTVLMDGAPTDDPDYDAADYTFTVPCDSPITSGDRVSYISNAGRGKAVSLSTLSTIAETAETTASEAQAVAEAVNQHFWHRSTDPDQDGAGTGAFVTDEEQGDFLAAAADGFTDYDPDTKPYRNMLMNSLGVLIRSALYNLASFTQSAITFFDGRGNAASNVVASFGANGATIGRESGSHVSINDNGLALSSVDGIVIAEMANSETTSTETIRRQENLSRGDTIDIVMDGIVSGSAIKAAFGYSLSNPYTMTQGVSATYTYQAGAVNATLSYDGAETVTVSVTSGAPGFTIEYRAAGIHAPYFTLGTRTGSASAFSAAIGKSISLTNGGVAVGQYNADDGGLFQVGIGTGDTARRNAVSVGSSGDVSLYTPLAIANGGSGDTGTKVHTTVSDIITAGTGITISAANFARWGKVAMLQLAFSRSSAIAQGGNITIGTVKTGFRPEYAATAGGTRFGGWITNAGAFTCTNFGAQIAANTTVYISATYLLP